MKLKILQLTLQGTIIGLYFTNMFNYYDNENKVLVSGFKAIITNQYYYIGNIMILAVLLAAVFQFVFLVISFFNLEYYKRKDDLLVTIINIEIVVGLLMVTFLGIHLEWLGILVIAIIILSTLIKHKFKT
jgi:hypothetical protein